MTDEGVYITFTGKKTTDDESAQELFFDWDQESVVIFGNDAADDEAREELKLVMTVSPR